MVPSLFELSDRVAIITGAGQGIGRAYAHAFAEAGAVPVIAELDGDAGERVAAEVRAQGREALAVQTDVGSVESIDTLMGATLEAFGRVDVLVNNASIFATIKMRPFEEIPLAEWEQVLHVNVTGSFLMAQAVAGPMRERGWGRIINTSSAAVTMGRPNYLHYTTSKAAIIGMTRSLARELGAHGITVNAVLPGATETEIERETVTPEQKAAMIAMRCIHRAETPDDLIGLTLFLASDASAFLTGQSITVDGGLTHL
jgi:3-oxoacyl-[acyl-carrier protein] reductase